MQDGDYECGSIAVPEELVNNRKTSRTSRFDFTEFHGFSSESHHINNGYKFVRINLNHKRIVFGSLAGFIIYGAGISLVSFSITGPGIFVSTDKSVLSNAHVDHYSGELSIYSQLPLDNVKVIVNYKYSVH